MILDEIVIKRREQLVREKKACSFDEMKKRALSKKEPTRGFMSVLKKERLALIAEVKKASPSKGVIREDFHPVKIAMEYEAAGADALSVLTEEHYFKGSGAYLSEIRKAVGLPLLRKDFIIDPYQIYEARVLGADAVLLIAALLCCDEIREFQALAQSLGLAALVEVHNEEELFSAQRAGAEIIGVNNRDLKTFRVDLSVTEALMKHAGDAVLVSESGIRENSDMKRVRAAGADAVLVGETLMKSGDIKAELAALRARV